MMNHHHYYPRKAIPPRRTNGDDDSGGRDSRAACFSPLIRKLVTREDPYHLHKSLGVLALLHCIWRFYLYYFDNDDEMGFVRYPALTIPTLLIHLLLTSTSFVFAIPRQRIKAGGWRIWPEYRLHSAIFTTRSVAFVALYSYELSMWQQREKEVVVTITSPPSPLRWLDLVLVLSASAAADAASWSQGPDASPTIRGVQQVPVYVKYFFSSVQTIGTAYLLWGHRTCRTNMLGIFVIQFNAFLMTLQRKNVLQHGTVVTIYCIMLGVALHMVYGCMMAAGYRNFLLVHCAAMTGTLIRLGPRYYHPHPNCCYTNSSRVMMYFTTYLQNNKFILWSTIFGMMQLLRPDPVTDAWPIHGVTDRHMEVAAVASLIGWIALGIDKVVSERRTVQGSKSSI